MLCGSFDCLTVDAEQMTIPGYYNVQGQTLVSTFRRERAACILAESELVSGGRQMISKGTKVLCGKIVIYMQP